MGMMMKRRRRVPREKRPERKKFCRLCARKVQRIDYKDVDMLLSFMTDRAKIVPRRTSGNCAKHQRALAAAIRRARTVALVPYTGDQRG